MNQRAPHEIEELVSALNRHIRLLRKYARKAFDKGYVDYGGEVAGKLRLLATRFGSNQPLLLDLMERTGISPLVTLGGPPNMPLPGQPGPGDSISLEQYMNLNAMGIRVPNGEFVILTKTQFVRGWAEQTGSSHEDWSLDPALAAVLNSPIYIGGLHGAFAELRESFQTVLHIASQFLTQFHAREEQVDA